MSLPDTAEYWRDVKDHRKVKGNSKSPKWKRQKEHIKNICNKEGIDDNEQIFELCKKYVIAECGFRSDINIRWCDIAHAVAREEDKFRKYIKGD